MNKSIIICVGISGAGKSTWSEEFINENSNYLRCNRDSIREWLIPNHRKTWYTRPDRDTLENFVSRLEMLFLGNSGEKNIIMDNTNCKLSTLKSLIKILEGWQTPWDIRFKFFDIDLREAKARAYHRDHGMVQNPEDEEDATKYIDRQHAQFQATKKWIEENYSANII